MDREEKEMAIALGVAAVLAVVVCTLSFQLCIIGLIISVTAYLFADTWGEVFGKGMKEVCQRQMQSHDRPRCVADN